MVPTSRQYGMPSLTLTQLAAKSCAWVRVPSRDEARDDVLAEVVARLRVVGVAQQHLVQERRVEHVDAHAGERAAGPAGHRRRLRRLLLEAHDPAPVVDRDDAQRTRVGERDVDAGDGHLRLRLDVVLEHPAVVHLVDVVAGQDQHVLADRGAAGCRGSGRPRPRCPGTRSPRSAAAPAAARRTRRSGRRESSIRAARAGSGSATCTACRCRPGGCPN